MNETVERMARAIYLTQAKVDDHSDGANDLAFQTDQHWESCIPHARAVIATILKPTDEVINAGIRKGVDIGFGVGYDEYRDLYLAMIEEMLK